MKAFLFLALLIAPAAVSARDYIATPSGSRVGYLEWHGDRQEAYTASGRRLGYYERSSDTTRDASGRIVARGNAAAALIIHL